MKISVELGDQYTEPEIIIRCSQMDGQIEALMQLLNPSADKLTVTRDDKLFFLTDTDIFYFESVDRKCFVYTQNDTYESGVVLLELEKTLNQRRFARISKSAIVNLGKVKSIARNFDATMTLELTSGEKLIASRHYAQTLKERLMKL